MKDKLLEVLSVKLEKLSDDIKTLNEMNSNLEKENEGLDYIRGILKLFETPNDEYSVYRFSNLEYEDFNKVMGELKDDVKTKFETENCNYEGLIYLINGINSGISLKLTTEQIDAIQYMIDSIVDCQMNYLSRIDGILSAKSNLEINDLNELTSIKEKYDGIVLKLESNQYVSETDEIVDSLNYAKASNEEIINVLTFLLQYNSEIYLLNKENVSKHKNEEKQDLNENNNTDNEEINLNVPFVVEEEKEENDVNEETTDTFNELNFDNIDDDQNDETAYEINDELSLPETALDNPEEENVDDDLMDIDLPFEEEIPVDEDFKDIALEDDEDIQAFVDTEYEDYDNEEDSDIDDNNFEEVVSEKTNDLEETVRELLNQYKIKYDNFDEENKNLLLSGNVDDYRNILDFLKERNILEIYTKNHQLLIKTLVHSNVDNVQEVLKVIEEKLSVDKEDMKITINIMISALPSVFVKEPYGNYETFMKNVKLFEQWNIDLINLFDFSREVYVLDNEKMVKNYELVKTYDLSVNDKNAKYLLGLPNLGEKIDYYVEAVAVDNMKNGTGKTFDGYEYIKDYPSKLNTVTDTTIKRLKYSSINGRKIFGAKENSLAGEITNLKVDVLNMDDEYLRNYFNNNFDIISDEEKMRYEELMREENNYSMELDDTLKELNKYLNGLRYNIDGVSISRNKLVRNYNTLVKNGVDRTNALIFAACYNSVITKEEYQKVKNALSNIGGR